MHGIDWKTTYSFTKTVVTVFLVTIFSDVGASL